MCDAQLAFLHLAAVRHNHHAGLRSGTELNAVLCSALGLLASSSKKVGRLSGYAERIVEAEQAAKQIALDTSRARWHFMCI